MANILLLNGPPGSGKDTLANHLASKYQFLHYKFAERLKYMTHCLYEVPEPYRSDMCSFGETKDKPNDMYFHGKTPRECYIAVAENLIKPLHGKDFFGKLLATEIRNRQINFGMSIVISDCGFPEEVAALLEELKMPAILCKLKRDGHNFNKDSRSYLNRDALPEQYIEKELLLVNNCTELEFLTESVSVLKPYFKGWL